MPYDFYTHQPGAEPPAHPIQLQFSYGWKWFKYHADQRIKMFNFMLLAFGVFATALSTTLEASREAAVGLCVVAVLMGAIFLLLDFRNRNLTWLGEDLLAHLEPAIFGTGRSIQCKHGAGQQVQLGLLTRAEQERTPLGLGFLTPHRYLIPATAVLIMLSFAVAGVAIATRLIDGVGG